MAHAGPVTADRFNAGVIDEYRANEGRVGGPLAGTPLILIHHIGARSGIERVTPLACIPHGDGRWVIVASNGGSPAHPGWYHNLKATPTIDVELGTRTLTMVAEEVTGAARDELWANLLGRGPTLVEFDARTDRQIPVFVLTAAGARR